MLETSWFKLYLQASNEFIAMKKIPAMKIHHNEKEKFMAFSILDYYWLFFFLDTDANPLNATHPFT